MLKGLKGRAGLGSLDAARMLVTALNESSPNEFEESPVVVGSLDCVRMVGHPEVIHLAESGVCGLRFAESFADSMSRTLAPGATPYTAAAFRCDQSSLLSARRHELAHIGVRHAETFFEGLGEIGAVVAWVVELILIFNVQPAGVSYIG